VEVILKRNNPPEKERPVIDWEKEALAREAFGTSAFLSVNKLILSTLGPELAVYIGNLIDKEKYFIRKGKIGRDGSFFLRHEDQQEQTGMSKHQIRKCKKKLKELGVLYTEMRGTPPKEFYILHLSKLTNEVLTNNHSNLERIIVQIFNEYSFKSLTNIKENKFKENKFKENKKEDIHSQFTLDQFPNWKGDPHFQEAVKNYCTHRKEIKKPITPQAGKMLATKLKKYSKDVAIQALTRSVENGWTGVFPESINNNGKQQKSERTTSYVNYRNQE
jgi:hypothetical protein